MRKCHVTQRVRASDNLAGTATCPWPSGRVRTGTMARHSPATADRLTISSNNRNTLRIPSSLVTEVGTLSHQCKQVSSAAGLPQVAHHFAFLDGHAVNNRREIGPDRQRGTHGARLAGRTEKRAAHLAGLCALSVESGKTCLILRKFVVRNGCDAEGTVDVC
jgi:hypothetical protein